MRVALVLGVIGHLLRLFPVAFVPPLVLALFQREFEVALWFAIALAVSAGAGHGAARLFRRGPTLRRAEAMAVVAGSWMVVAIFGAIPYVFAGLGPIDAWFESMSGFTTTGATILTDFSAWRADGALYLWRAMTQWFGGLGVIALFVVILPRLGIAGRQLFFAEASGAPSDAIGPQVRETARKLWLLYTGLTVLLAILLRISGVGLFDAVVHALTTMSAGGFSPKADSIASFAPTTQWILVVFMVLAGTSYTLQWLALTRGPRKLFQDSEFLTYLLVMAGLSIALAFALGRTWVPATMGEELTTEASLRYGCFQVASLASSTGYANVDFALWHPGPLVLLLIAMLFGGCAGSACGGPKVVRWIVMTRFLKREMTQALHPRAVIALKYKDRPITPPILRSVVNLIVLYVLGYFLVGAILAIFGNHSIEEAFSAAIACVGNVGPAFESAGPMLSYHDFAPLERILLLCGMWVGRLEIVTVLALLHAHVWGGLRWERDAPRPPG